MNDEIDKADVWRALGYEVFDIFRLTLDLELERNNLTEEEYIQQRNKLQERFGEAFKFIMEAVE